MPDIIENIKEDIEHNVERLVEECDRRVEAAERKQVEAENLAWELEADVDVLKEKLRLAEQRYAELVETVSRRTN